VAEVSPVLGAIEVLDRDGQVRQSLAVRTWPVAVGRALDNDLVLADPHVAAHHFRIAATDTGLAIEVGDTRNGVTLGARQLGAGATQAIDAHGKPPLIAIGRTRLRLRLATHALEPELPLVAPASRWGHGGVLAAAAAALVAGLLVRTWLEADPDVFGRAALSAVLALGVSVALWCGAWALLSRIFTRQAQFGWHLRVFVFASLAWLVVEAASSVLAFAFDWTWLADFAFVGTMAVAGAALTFHLYAVEPSRPRLMRAVGAVAAAAGTALTMWFNVQRTDRFGDDLYFSRLLPPTLRLAGTVPVDRFVDGLAALQAPLDRKAREPSPGDTGPEEE
jgi:hypothetical protein